LFNLFTLKYTWQAVAVTEKAKTTGGEIFLVQILPQLSKNDLNGQ